VSSEIAVVGGGILGLSIAWGLRRLGHDVVVIDEGDQALRASRGNFGLIWVQGKGLGFPEYARWTRQSAGQWPAMAAELQQRTGIDLELEQRGGIDFCLSEQEASERVAELNSIRDAVGDDYEFDYFEHSRLESLLPGIGDDVAGATFCPADGHVNPLYLLRAFYSDFLAMGGRVVNNESITGITMDAGSFRVQGQQRIDCEKIVLCAGLGNRELSPMIGLRAPVEPNRGHLLITERVEPLLNYPSVQLRQVGEGAIQIGDSLENAGLDDSTSTEIITEIANRAVRILPRLAHLQVVRSWAALRVMTPDGFPIYEESTTHPGAFVVTCHSGVTLAAAHALTLAPWIGSGNPVDGLSCFGAHRFAL